MPLVKQGKFKEYYDKCNKIKEDVGTCHNKYFSKNGDFKCKYEPFSEFFYAIDAIYCEARLIKGKLEGLVEISEQKTSESIEKCNKYIKEMEKVISLCIDDFITVYDLYDNNFTDMEKNTLPNFEIYKEIMYLM